MIIWDFEERREHCKLTLHRVKVEALAFSPNDKYLVSLGGGDDGRYAVAFLTRTFLLNLNRAYVS